MSDLANLDCVPIVDVYDPNGTKWKDKCAALEAALEQEKKYDIEKQRDIWADSCKKAWSQRDAAIAQYERAKATIDSLIEDVIQACRYTDADDIRSHLEEYL
jgi:hypothetical protein